MDTNLEEALKEIRDEVKGIVADVDELYDIIPNKLLSKDEVQTMINEAVANVKEELMDEIALLKDDEKSEDEDDDDNSYSEDDEED